MSKKNFILPILYLYWLKNIAVAIHISKNDVREIISKNTDNGSAYALLPERFVFVTYEMIEYGFTSGIDVSER